MVGDIRMVHGEIGELVIAGAMKSQEQICLWVHRIAQVHEAGTIVAVHAFLQFRETIIDVPLRDGYPQ